MNDSPWQSNGFTRLSRAARSGLRGIRYRAHDSAIRQVSAATLVLLLIALVLPVSRIEKLILVQSTLLVPFAEYINSAIESAVDRTSLDHHPLAARAKELASVAVGVAVLICAVAWGGIVIPLAVSRLGPG